MRKKIEPLNPGLLHQVFGYDKDVGSVFRIDGAPLKLKLTGGRKGDRYLSISLGSYMYYIHRLVWAIHHAVWPTYIDHINRDKRDNRIENLRECSPHQNQYNTSKRSHNRSGYKGVYSVVKKCPNRPWLAKIVVNSQRIELGYFSNVEDAARCYDEALRSVASTFANTNFKDKD